MEGFQSQLDDVLTLHRNELHRRSETLFDDLNETHSPVVRGSQPDSGKQFDEQVRGLVEPHIEQTNDAISRMAGGRSLLDASLSLQQDRIRSAADEAFAESLARFRENLGGVEQLLHEASQGVIKRNLTELESKAGDIRAPHRRGNLQDGGMVREESTDATKQPKRPDERNRAEINCANAPARFPRSSPLS